MFSGVPPKPQWNMMTLQSVFVHLCEDQSCNDVTLDFRVKVGLREFGHLVLR